MIPKRFEDITFADIQALKVNAVEEGKIIEYKREISSTDQLLAGISAFANTSGGDFVVGIEAVKGVPVNLPGLFLADADAEKLRIEQAIQNGIEPRLPASSHFIKILKSPTGEDFILIRVNKSWVAPHRVKASRHFYGRNSAGKFSMDVSELKTAFMLNEQLSERIKNFKQDRIRKIQIREELPVPLHSGGKMVLHLLPLSSFNSTTEFDLLEIRRKAQFPPVIAYSHDKRINIDGIIIAGEFSKKTKSYVQVFRNGCIEAVNCLDSQYDDTKDYSSRYVEELFIKALSEYIKFYQDLGVELPIHVFLTLIDVKGYKFHLDDGFWNIYETRDRMTDREKLSIERNDLIIPETIIDNYQIPAAEILRPAYNLIWNSVGFTRDLNYQEDGTWIDDLRSYNRR